MKDKYPWISGLNRDPDVKLRGRPEVKSRVEIGLGMVGIYLLYYICKHLFEVFWIEPRFVLSFFFTESCLFASVLGWGQRLSTCTLRGGT